MAKYYGNIGFAISGESPANSGIWVDEVVDKPYHGDVLNRTLRWQSAQDINDNATFSQRISIICDSFAINNIPSIKYVEFLGARWSVTSVEIQRPRIILTLGGLYNGEQT